MENWYRLWHVGTPCWKIGTTKWKTGTPYSTLARSLARWHVKMRSWRAFGTQARWHVNHASTQARWHVNRAGTQARWHVDHVGTQARMSLALANFTHSTIWWNQLNRLGSIFTHKNDSVSKLKTNEIILVFL